MRIVSNFLSIRNLNTIYDFHSCVNISIPIIYGSIVNPQKVNRSQLALWLNWWCPASASQRSAFESRLGLSRYYISNVIKNWDQTSLHYPSGRNTPWFPGFSRLLAVVVTKDETFKFFLYFQGFDIPLKKTITKYSRIYHDWNGGLFFNNAHSTPITWWYQRNWITCFSECFLLIVCLMKYHLKPIYSGRSINEQKLELGRIKL